MTVPPPPGMKLATWNYVCDFTQTFEGPTNFMYNNWPAKSKTEDVTCGIGIKVYSENDACTPAIKNMFRVKGTDNIPSNDQMKADFRRAAAKRRTDGNLWEYQRESLLYMDNELMWDGMKNRIKEWLAAQRQPGVCPGLADFENMPAQAQAAITSYNYGRRIQNSPKMWKALAAGNYDKAGYESWLEGLDEGKLIGHRTLFYNAARIVEQGLDADILPSGFKPPSRIPWKLVSYFDVDRGEDVTPAQVEPPPPDKRRPR